MGVVVLWKHHNDCVFNDVSINVNKVMWVVKEEGTLCATRARELQGLFLGIG